MFRPILIAAILFTPFALLAQDAGKQPPPAVPSGVAAFDTPNDKGETVSITWIPMGDEVKVGAAQGIVWEVQIATAPEGPFQKAVEVKAGEGWKKDKPEHFWFWNANEDLHWAGVDPSEAFPPATAEKLKEAEKALAIAQEDVTAAEKSGTDSLPLEETLRGAKSLKREREAAHKAAIEEIRTRIHYYRVVARGPSGETPSAFVSAAAHGNLFHTSKTPHLMIFLFLSTGILAFIAIAKRNPNLYLRKIPGLAALDEAIGRATEMGKPLYFLTGRLGLSDNEQSVSTIAAMIVLGKVAEKVATYDCALKVPHTDPVVAGVCHEMTRESYIRAGRPDSWREEINPYISSDQFSYTAAVTAMISREKPAAVMYFGYYYAESLLLAESGNSVGAIQVAATDADHQLPFFFAACDYTLIGEELYAAAAYVSREPVLLGTLRGQDLGKALLLLCVIVGSVVATIGALDPDLMSSSLHYVPDFFKTPFSG